MCIVQTSEMDLQMRAVARLLEIIESLRSEMARAYKLVEDAYHKVDLQMCITVIQLDG